MRQDPTHHKNKSPWESENRSARGLNYLGMTGHEIAVVMAGNGNDDPKEIESLVDPVLGDECDYAQDSRYLPGGRFQRMQATSEKSVQQALSGHMDHNHKGLPIRSQGRLLEDSA